MKIVSDEENFGKPWAIPHSWEWVKISDVAVVVGGGTPKTSNPLNYGGEIPWITPADLSGYTDKTISAGTRNITEQGLDTSGARMLPKGAVLFSSRAPIGYVAIASVDLSTNQGFKSFVPENGISSDYLYYWLKFAKPFADKLASGTTFMEISGAKAALIPFPAAPKEEQLRIVEKLEELLSDLDSGVAELKTAQKKLTQYRQSLLKSAVEGSLTADWRAKRVQSKQPLETGAQLLERILKERRKCWEEKQLDKFKEQDKKPPKNWKDKYPEPVQPDTSDLTQLPEGWVWASIDQCALDEISITDGPFGSNLKSEHYTKEGPRVIRLQNIGDGEFIDARAHISTEHYSSLLKHAVKENDLVVAMLGESLPRACLIPGNLPPAIVKADCARVRVNDGLVLPDFINACMNSRTTKERVVSLIKGIGRPRINLGNIRKIQIPIPPMSEQVEIISVLLAAVVEITNQMSAIDVGLRQADAQRKNLLKSAFSGELVEQDLNDESARILLNRIREGRSKQKKQLKLKSPRLSKKSQKMKKSNEEILRDWVENHPEGKFSFENIRNSFTGEYESLKDEVFKLLDGKEPILKQIFDKKAGSIRFERVKK